MTIVKTNFGKVQASRVRFQPSGTIASTNVQDAIEEVATEVAVINIVDDATPQLGGNLDVNGNSITSASNGDVTIDPNGTGDIILGAPTITVEQDIVHSGDLDNKVVFGVDTQDFQTGGSSRVDISDAGVRFGGANARVTTILDEDAMSSNSATALATQQSIKAYVDAVIPEISEDTTPQLGGNLDVNGNSITSASNGNITIDPNGTGDIVLACDTVTIEQDLVHSGDLDNKFVFGVDTQDFQTGGSSRLDISDSGVRLGGANARVTTVLDEDTMSSDSATALATQQSIKAYVDSEVAAASGGTGTGTLASAATTDLSSVTNSLTTITGTTTITALGTEDAGIRKHVLFDDALTVTHNATSLILPGAANILTRADDRATFVSLGSGNWICEDYMRDSTPIGWEYIAGGTEAGTGTTITLDYSSTDFPSHFHTFKLVLGTLGVATSGNRVFMRVGYGTTPTVLSSTNNYEYVGTTRKDGASDTLNFDSSDIDGTSSTIPLTDSPLSATDDYYSNVVIDFSTIHDAQQWQRFRITSEMTDNGGVHWMEDRMAIVRNNVEITYITIYASVNIYTRWALWGMADA